MATSTNEDDDLAWTLEQRRRFSISESSSNAPRRSIELSVENLKMVRRASMLLSNPAGPEAVLSQADIKRLEGLQRFNSKYFGAARRDGKSQGTGSMSSSMATEDEKKNLHDEQRMNVIVKTARNPSLRWIVEGRQKLRAIVKDQWFRGILYFVVVADVLVLAFDNEYVTGPALAQLDIAFTVLLLMEVVLKVVAFGLWGHKDAYFQRSYYRFLQLFLLILSLVSHCNGASNQWKVLRGLKTVRSLTLHSGLRRILKALMRAVPFLANVGTLAMFGLLAFSIFGLEAYSGSYDNQCAISLPKECDNSTSLASSASRTMVMEALATIPRAYCSANSSCASNHQTCQAMIPPSSHVNFDSGLSSLFLVFLVVAQDGWVTDIMKPVIESSSFLSVLFFIAIVASMVFLVVNLFVAVITTAFMNFTLDSEGEKEKPHFMGKLDPAMEETHVNMIMGATLVIEDTISGEEASGTKIDTELPTIDRSGASISDDTNDETAIAEQNASNSKKRMTATVPTVHQVEETSSLQPWKYRSGSAHGYKKSVNCKEDYVKLLTKMRQWQSLRNLTVETTMHLIQNGVLMEEVMGPLTKSYKNGDLPTENAMGPPPPLIPRKKALAMELTPHFDFYTSTHALVMKNTESTSPQFVKFQHFVLSKKFDDFITLCIILNTLCLLVEYPNMSTELDLILSITEYFFGVIFLLEMTMRIVAMRGLRVYLSSTERIFDMAVVFCTTGNLILNNLEASFSGLNSASSLRTLRVTRLMMKYEGTRKLIQSVLKSSRGVMNVVMFMLVFQVVNSIIGMQLFGGSHLVGKDGEVPRWNFDTFGRSFLTLLQVITGDQWSSITYDAVDAAHPHWLMVPFLILNFIVGQYVLLNLFIAVILENFSISEEEAYQLQLAQIIAIPKELDIYEKIEEVGVRAFGEMDQLENVSNVKLRLFLGLDDNKKDENTGQSDVESSNFISRISHMSPRDGFPSTHALNQTRINYRSTPHHVPAWKKLCRHVAMNIWFSRLVQFMILVSCICLVLDEPYPEMSVSPPSRLFDFALLAFSRIALVVLFVEFVVKVGTFGFGIEYLRLTIFHSDEMLGYVHRQTYMENKWNQLDLALLLLAVADEIITTINPTFTLSSVFRAGRVLRPLRMLNHNHEMKVILNAVARSLPHVGNVLALCLIVYIIFGIVGRSLFSEQFYFCNDSQVASAEECVGFYLAYPNGVLPFQEVVARGVPGGAVLTPRVWQNARFSFDNIGAGFLTLLEMTSLKWVDKAFAAMDIAGVGKQPVMDASAQAAIFFVLYIYVGSLFVIRLFVGVLVEQFQRNNGTEILTESQKSWVDLEKFILLLKPLKSIPRPRMKMQAKLYDLCKHPYFSTGISIAIVLNLVLLLVSPRSAGGTSLSFKIIEIIFLTIFTLEGLIKCIGLRQYYFFQPQGMFEVAILSGSIVAYFFATGYHTIIQAGRVFRMMRVLRFVHLNRGVYTVYQTFRASLRPLGQIFFLMFMIYFIFAIVARQLFGGVRYGPAMNSFSNFRSFGSATLLLFQIMSGDDWHLTMTDCMIQKPFCAERISVTTGLVYSDCGSIAASALFFVTYVTLVVFVFLNLFIAVILENFRSCYLKSDVCAVSLLDFEAYREVFLRYDVNNSGYFPLWQLASFLSELPPGLRVNAHRDRIAFLQLRTQAQAQWGPALDGRKRPYFNELLRILCIHQLGIRSLPYEQQRDRVKQIFIYRAKVAQMLVDSYVEGYILRWRLRRARLAQLALLKVDRATSTCDDLNDDHTEPAKAQTKDVETQTGSSKDRHRHHHRHHRRKHQKHSEEHEHRHKRSCQVSMGHENGILHSPEQFEADQNSREEKAERESNFHITSTTSTHVLPPVVMKKHILDPIVSKASHSAKVCPS
ncbi:putative voltage-dependent calcium channel, alpha-1 subunit [Plasmopara halstedii]